MQSYNGASADSLHVLYADNAIVKSSHYCDSLKAKVA
jgi:hypothetical protein